MNLSEMSTFVREQADTDIADASDSKLTVYARAAYRDIIARVFPWPDKEVSYIFDTVVGQPGYLLSALSVSDMEYVVSVWTADDVLDYVSNERYLDRITGSTGNGTPSVYTIEDGYIKLWPLPATVETYMVTGYRAFADWPSGSSEPDLPRAFDEAICWYMLARFYQSQEDLELTQMYMRDFEVAVNQQLGRSLRDSSVSAGPMIFGGGRTVPSSYSDWVKRSVEG